MFKIGQKVLCDNVETKFRIEDGVEGIILAVNENQEKFDEETGEFIGFDTLYTVAFVERRFGYELTEAEEDQLFDLGVKFFDCTKLFMFADDVFTA